MNKRGQTLNGGLITGLVFGIASLVIVIIIALVITSTMGDANLLTAGRPSVSVVNESGIGINQTGDTLAGSAVTNFVPSSITITTVFNETNGTVGYPLLVTSANYSVSSTGVITSTTPADWNFTNANVSYSYNTYANEELSETALSGNFTVGINNVSGKVPTALLVAAIVLILGVLGILVEVWRRMQLGGSL
jgi:hypothetical protein